MLFFVSRQCYWGVDPDNCWVVEIAGEGKDYANPDMLCEKYPGEGKEYTDPREAVKAALEIAELWKKDAPDKVINVACGFTGGMTIPFEPSNKAVLIKWANKIYRSLPKCDQCGKLLPENGWFTNMSGDAKFCREHCADRWLAKQNE